MVRGLVLAVMLALAAQVAPIACLVAPTTAAALSHHRGQVPDDPKDEAPRKKGDAAVKRCTPCRARSAAATTAPNLHPLWTIDHREPSFALDEPRRTSHLRRLSRPSVLQVFRN